MPDTVDTVTLEDAGASMVGAHLLCLDSTVELYVALTNGARSKARGRTNKIGLLWCCPISLRTRRMTHSRYLLCVMDSKSY